MIKSVITLSILFYFILFFRYDASISYTWNSTNQLLYVNFIPRHEVLSLIKLDLHKVECELIIL